MERRLHSWQRGDQAPDRLNPTFCKLYPESGRPSIPREHQQLALFLQAIYGIRSGGILIDSSAMEVGITKLFTLTAIS
jgi:hypothetical protein